MSLDNLVFQAPDSTTCDRANAESTQPTPVAKPERHGEPKRPVLLPIVILAASLAAMACAQSPEHPWVVRDGLIEVETYGNGQLFVKRDHHLGSYDDLLIDHVGFRYGPGQERLGEKREDRIVSMLLGAIQGSQDGTIGIREEPGPCVLAVNFFLKDLEFDSPIASGGSVTSFVSSYGAATMVLELRDSVRQEPLARFVQRRDLGGGSAASSYGTSLARLAHVMDFAIRDMGNQLRKVIPPTTGSQQTACHGGMARVSLGSR